MSEYGMLSMPNYSSTEKFTLPEDRYLYSDVIKAHQKSGKGFIKLNSYLNRYFIDSTKIKNEFKDFIFDIRQAELMCGQKKKVIHKQEHHKYKPNLVHN